MEEYSNRKSQIHALSRKLTCASLSVCVWGGGPVGKKSLVFKNWKSLEKNTERKKERGGGERGVDGETQRGNRKGRRGEETRGRGGG